MTPGEALYLEEKRLVLEGESHKLLDFFAQDRTPVQAAAASAALHRALDEMSRGCTKGSQL